MESSSLHRDHGPLSPPRAPAEELEAAAVATAPKVIRLCRAANLGHETRTKVTLKPVDADGFVRTSRPQ